MVKIVDFVVVVNAFTILLNIYALATGDVNGWNVLALLLCSFALGSALITERLKLKKIEDILNKVKEERGLSWDESF